MAYGTFSKWVWAIGGVLPTRPRNRPGYALLAHTFGKMRSCATGERSNIEIRLIELKNTIIRRNCFRSQVHPTQSVPAKHFRSYVHPTQSLQGKRFCTQVHHTIFPVKSFVITFPLHTVLRILSFALLNASHTVRRRNCVAKVVHHTHFLCVKRLRKVA